MPCSSILPLLRTHVDLTSQLSKPSIERKLFTTLSNQFLPVLPSNTRTFYHSYLILFHSRPNSNFSILFKAAVLATVRLSLPSKRFFTPIASKTPRILLSIHPLLPSLPARKPSVREPPPRHYHPTSLHRFSKTHTMSDTGVHNLGRYASSSFMSVIDFSGN